MVKERQKAQLGEKIKIEVEGTLDKVEIENGRIIYQIYQAVGEEGNKLFLVSRAIGEQITKVC